jgi:hypothetical protein
MSSSSSSVDLKTMYQSTYAEYRNLTIALTFFGIVALALIAICAWQAILQQHKVDDLQRQFDGAHQEIRTLLEQAKTNLNGAIAGSIICSFLALGIFRFWALTYKAMGHNKGILKANSWWT